MNLKEFLKPTIGKIILFFILMVGINLFLILFIGVYDARILVGLPLGFYPIGSFYCANTLSCNAPEVEFSWINLIIDIVFWYLVSCVIIRIYNKSKKK